MKNKSNEMSVVAIHDLQMARRADDISIVIVGLGKCERYKKRFLSNIRCDKTEGFSGSNEDFYEKITKQKLFEEDNCNIT